MAYVIGYVDKAELKKNPTYSRCYRTFRRHHGMSAIANITTRYVTQCTCITVHANFVIPNQFKPNILFYSYQKEGSYSLPWLLCGTLPFPQNFI